MNGTASFRDLCVYKASRGVLKGILRSMNKILSGRRSLLLAWGAFLSGATFLAIMTPVGEGFDELPHLGYIQYVGQLNSLPLLTHGKYPSQELESFLINHPVGWSVHRDPRFTAKSYEQYWASTPPSRAVADMAVKNLHFNGNYVASAAHLTYPDESHQPPLYYLLAAPVFAIASRYSSFVQTFEVLRLWSVLIASFIIPAAFVLAKSVFKSHAEREITLALIVLFPGLYPAIARISNDALAAPLACWALVGVVRFLKTEQSLYLYILALSMLGGLWTKSFFVPILLGVVLVLLAYGKIRPACTVLLVSIAGFPWYVLNILHSGSLTGLPEAVLAKSSIISSVAALAELDWDNVWRVARSSHIWIGNSSLLLVRTWMYQLIAAFFLLGILGLFCRPRMMLRFLPLIVSYIVFCAGLLYYTTQVFQLTGSSYANGWYLASFIPVEAVLFIGGMQGLVGKHWKWPTATCALFLLALFIYTAAFVELPYYSGLTAHTVSGSVTAYHPSVGDFPIMSTRLLRFYPNVPEFLPWLLLSFFAAFGIWNIFRLFWERRQSDAGETV